MQNKERNLFRVIIAGGRDFNDYRLLRRRMNGYLLNIKEEIVVVSGKAKGADALGERYAKEKGFSISGYPAEWDKYGKSAGYRRNAEMADNADALVAFWDGNSRGTKMMIELARRKNLLVRVVNY